MTIDYGPFDSGLGANRMEDFWRAYFRRVALDGVIAGVADDLEVYADSTGRQVKAKAGQAFTAGHWYSSDAEQTIAIDANATGSTRIDRIVVEADFAANTVTVKKVNGTASAPALTRNSSVWQVSLATVSVANNATTLAASAVTDDRAYSLANRPRLAVRAKRGNTDLTITTNTATDLTLGTHVYDDLDGRLHSDSTNQARFLAPWDGVYRFQAQVEWAADADGYRTVYIVDNNSTEWAKHRTNDAANLGIVQHIPPTLVRLSAGDYITLKVRHTAGNNLNVVGATNSGETWAAWEYVGP